MDVDRVVRCLYEINELIVNGLIVHICAVVLNINSEVGSSVVVIVEYHVLEAKSWVDLASAVEISLERVNICCIVSPAVIVLSQSRKLTVCKLSLRHIRVVESLYRKSEHKLELGADCPACVGRSDYSSALAFIAGFIKVLVNVLVYIELVENTEVSVGFAHYYDNIGLDTAVEVTALVHLDIEYLLNVFLIVVIGLFKAVSVVLRGCLHQESYEAVIEEFLLQEHIICSRSSVHFEETVDRLIELRPYYHPEAGYDSSRSSGSSCNSLFGILGVEVEYQSDKCDNNYICQNQLRGNFYVGKGFQALYALCDPHIREYEVVAVGIVLEQLCGRQ